MSNRNAASLTGSLLVRKGAAAPSHLERGAEINAPTPSRFTPRLAPEPSPISLRAANGKPAAAARRNGESGAKLVQIQPARSSGARSTVRRFTLRLSQEQHLRLRLASVHLGQSGQKLVLEALDEYLDRIAPELRDGNCACLLEGTVAPLLPPKKVKPAK